MSPKSDSPALCRWIIDVAALWDRACDNLVSKLSSRPLKSEVRRSEIEEEKNSKAVATKAVEFTEKWDSDHPTRCCVLGKTPIGKSFGTKLGETKRKVV